MTESIKFDASFEIHKAGGVYGDLVIEPVGNKNYIWKKCDKKGISLAMFEEENGIWYIEIDGTGYCFEGSPLDRLIYSLPSKEKQQAWTNGEYKSRATDDIYPLIKATIKSLLDFPFEHHYTIAALLILESWLVEKLNTVFYGSVVGGYGGGKTVTLEVLKSLSHHGCMAGNLTGAGSPRLIEEQKVTCFYDEIDVKDKDTDDSTLLMSIRQGYRRNNYYIRMNSKTYKPEFFDSFGVKVFSLHSDLERATKTRAFTINIGESNDNRLPVINAMKNYILVPVYEELFFWYLDNINNVYINAAAPPEISLSMKPEEIRECLYRHAVGIFSAKEIEFLNKFRGRNSELAYITLQLTTMLGIDILDELLESFNDKIEAEEEYSESSILSLIREILEKYLSQEFIEQKIVYDEVNNKLVDVSLNKMSSKKFSTYLREFGFIDKVNRKKKEIVTDEGKKKSVYHLFFDKRVKEKLSRLSQDSLLSLSNESEKKDTLLKYNVENKENEESVESRESVKYCYYHPANVAVMTIPDAYKQGTVLHLCKDCQKPEMI